uniref:Non-specific serine/threonine protein kinase (EC) n=1 Tax=Ganoderma boninense TaxID=34458 RepID=A0A5K1JWV0_9APHY|nr:Non-specific serine/threonine protein kinase (EC [Ganoderma boninense]
MKFRCLANVTPHLLDLQFDDDLYDRLTAGDVIDKALEACRASYDEAADDILPLQESRLMYYRLHYITDLAAAFKLDEAEAGNYDFRQGQPRADLHKQACGWYRTWGQCLQSKHVDPTALLRSEPMPEDRSVRWYFVVADSVYADRCTCASIYVLRPKQRCLDQRRAAYEEEVLEMLHEHGSANSTPSHVASYEADESPTGTTVAIGPRRPSGSWGLDPSLYSAAFARAVNDLEHLKDVVIETPVSERPQRYEQWLRDMDEEEVWARCLEEPFDMIRWISMLADVADDLNFKQERNLKSNERIHGLLEKFFDGSPLILHDMGPDTETDMTGECMTAHGLPAIWLVFESKLWNDTEGALPDSLRAYDYVRAVTACPCLVMGISGSDVVWYAVYFTDRLYATRLCRIRLDAGGSARAAEAEENENRAKFQVIRTLGRALREYYSNLHTGCTYRHTPHLLPQPTSIISQHCSSTASISELESLHLIFLDQVSNGNKFNSHHALFTGTIRRRGDPMRTPVYIKFVTSYGKEAHSYLASHEPPLAPQILFYGEVTSRLTMIVMEDLKAAVPIHHQSVLENDRLRSLIQPKAEEVLSVLHAGGFVHGDVRSPNLLMHPTTGRVYIIDFDWAGREALARYPTDLNPKVKWILPALLMRNKPIQKADDIFMLRTELSRLLGDEYIVSVQS